MTGFGSARSKIRYGIITVEIKTVNHKFLEITCKLPNSLSIFEDRIKTLERAVFTNPQFSRGTTQRSGYTGFGPIVNKTFYTKEEVRDLVQSEIIKALDTFKRSL